MHLRHKCFCLLWRAECKYISHQKKSNIFWFAKVSVLTFFFFYMFYRYIFNVFPTYLIFSPVFYKDRRQILASNASSQMSSITPAAFLHQCKQRHRDLHDIFQMLLLESLLSSSWRARVVSHANWTWLLHFFFFSLITLWCSTYGHGNFTFTIFQHFCRTWRLEKQGISHETNWKSI